ncbi:class I SAM-dependent methyltransferase [Glycomyces mayteni]|uniref:Class I SAM-dependent methyltransferase n=1 Tax=Glycomyces mayteni TaxID=543887 RepID=A0ABW2D9E8_9ACTN|nr:class I SAM-dependent methyltransferase [Glycomyces mayteni]
MSDTKPSAAASNAAVQGELWSSDPQSWAETAEGRILPLYERILLRLQPHSGTRLLDAGCGAGLFADLAARTGAKVMGLDAAPGLIAYARAHRPGPRYVVGDLGRIPFRDDAFDTVTAFNAVHYAADPHRALAEIARVSADRAVLTVGAGPDQARSAALVNPLAAPAEVPDAEAFDLTDPAAAGEALRRAGFATATTFDIAFDVDYASVDAAVAAQLPAGPVTAAVRHSGRAAVDAALRTLFAPLTRADGTVRMGMVFRCHLAAH